MLIKITLIATLAACNAELKKPIRLEVLSMLMFTGYEPRDNRLCQASIDLVVEIVNKRTDLLLDYHLVIDHRNEGPGGAMTIRSAIDFLRKWEKPDEQSSIPSPIMIGPFLSPACKAWGATAAHMNMVMIGGSCTSPVQTARRNLYANMYRIRGPAELSIYARLHYLKTHTLIRKFAILFNIGNSFNQDVANLLYHQALQNDFEVQAYEPISIDMNEELIVSLKQRDVRIFTIESAEANVGLRFLCLAHKNGLHGERYLFIFLLLGYVNIYNLGDQYFQDCNKREMVEQAMRSLFVGATLEATLPINQPTSLGHSLEDFEQLFAAKTENTVTADYDFRHLCYDRMLAAVMMLNETEKRLARLNLTLRDYVRKPIEIMLVANESARNLRYNSLRFGNFRYSDRVEWDLEPQLVTSFSNASRGLGLMDHVKCRENQTATNLSAFETILDLDTNFDIHLPNDSPQVRSEEVDISWPMFATICSLAGISTLIELAIAFVFIKKQRNETELFIFKILVLIGCFCLNVASILLAVRNSMKSSAVCQAEIIFTAVGVSFVHFPIASKLFKDHRSYHPWRINPKDWQWNRVQTTRTTSLRIRLSPRLNLDGKIRPIGYIAFVVSGCFINACFVMGWLVQSPINLERSTLVAPVYNEQDDSWTTFWVLKCKTEGFGWLGIILCWNALALMPGLFSAVKLRKVSIEKEDSLEDASWKYDVRSFLLACIGASTLYICLIAVVFMVSAKQWLQMATISFGTIIYSFVICLLIFRSLFFH